MILPFKDTYPEIPETAFIAQTAVITGDVKIGDYTSIWYGASIRGDVSPTRIGKRVIIQDNCTLHQSPDIRMVVEDDVIIGHNAVLHSCYICHGALIGINSIILDHSVVGKYAMIAAGSLVPPGKKIPEGTLAMGSPAKSVRTLTDKEIENMEQIRKRYEDKRRFYQSIQGNHL